MGVVYRARQLELDRVVALKVISPERVEDPSVRERFLGEARAAAAVEHPNVLPVYGAGVEDGQAFLVMRHVPGQDLRTLVRTEGPLDLARAAEICVALGDALDAIHAGGYVHRDVKPANVLLDTSGHVYLTDFGLAKHALTEGGMTGTGRWVGTLDFAAPEQIRGEPVDARTDVYALGAVLFFMVSGRVPFERDSDPARLFAHLNDEPPRASVVRPGVPAAMDAVIARALAKDPAERYAAAGVLAGAAAVAAGRPDLSGSATRSSRAPPRPRRRFVPVLVLLAGLLAVIAAFLLATRDDKARPGGRPNASPTPTAAPHDTGPHVTDVVRGLGMSPRSVAVAGDSVLVSSAGSTRILRFDARTLEPIRPALRFASRPWTMAADGDRLWVVLPGRGQVVGVNARSGRVTRRIRTPLRPVGIAIDRRGVWISGRAIDVVARPANPDTPDILYRYGRDGVLRDQHPISSGIRMMATGGGAVWVALWDRAQLLRIGRHGRRRINFDDPPMWLAYGDGRMWASTASALERVDARLRARIGVSVASKPAQLAVLRGRLYAAITTQNELAITDARTGTEVEETLPVATNPFAITSGAGAIWVGSVGAAGTLSRIGP